MKELYYKAIFVFNKKIPKRFQNAISNEFMRLRPYAVEALNPHYEKWNEEYDGPGPAENDELADYGGTEYCRYICGKTREVLTTVNKEHPSRIIELDVQEFGDIIARCKFMRNITMELELMPIKN